MKAKSTQAWEGGIRGSAGRTQRLVCGGANHHPGQWVHPAHLPAWHPARVWGCLRPGAQLAPGMSGGNLAPSAGRELWCAGWQRVRTAEDSREQGMTTPCGASRSLNTCFNGLGYLRLSKLFHSREIFSGGLWLSKVIIWEKNFTVLRSDKEQILSDPFWILREWRQRVFSLLRKFISLLWTYVLICKGSNIFEICQEDRE